MSNLFDVGALTLAFEHIARRSSSPGRDKVTPAAYRQHLDENLVDLRARLLGHRWRPSPVLHVDLKKPDGGTRRLSIPTVEDRIVIEVLRRHLEPRIEPFLSASAFAYRPGRSARAAVEAVDLLIRRGAAWVALADVQTFFDTVPIPRVMDQLRALSLEPDAQTTLERLLEGHASGRRTGLPMGLAQGSALSPLLSNLILAPLDRRLASLGFTVVRYADNLCVASDSQDDAQRALRLVRAELELLGLRSKAKAEAVRPVSEGFHWLGFRIGAHGARVSEGAIAALVRRAQALIAKTTAGGEVAALSPLVRGWCQYFDGPLPPGLDLGPAATFLVPLIEQHRAAPVPVGDEGIVEPWDDDHEDQEDEGPSSAEGDAADVEALLARADEAAALGDYLAAQSAYEQAEAQRRSPPSPPPAPAEPTLELEDLAVDGFAGVFLAGNTPFEMTNEAQRVTEPLSTSLLARHLSGATRLAVLPRRPDDSSTLGVLDIDPEDVSPTRGPMSLAGYAKTLLEVAASIGLPVLMEDTGGRGRHLWFPLDRPARADQVARALDAIVADIQPPRGVRVERLPARDDEPDRHGQRIQLPLGLHRGGGRSRLWLPDGQEVEATLAGLLAVEPIPHLKLLEWATDAGPVAPEAPPPGPEVPTGARFGAEVQRVLGGCVILRDLVGRAEATGHLNHAERLSLLYSLGHLGEAGRTAIHEVLRPCANYSERETSRQIGRLSGLPIGCTRMREKHVREATRAACVCEFAHVRSRGGYPTPLLHAGGFRSTWRKLLKTRRLKEAEAPPPGAAGVAPTEPRATASHPAMDAAAASHATSTNPPDDGQPGLPPHAWA
jgi:RNA-directed DNA polymerase